MISLLSFFLHRRSFASSNISAFWCYCTNNWSTCFEASFCIVTVGRPLWSNVFLVDIAQALWNFLLFAKNGFQRFASAASSNLPFTAFGHIPCTTALEFDALHWILTARLLRGWLSLLIDPFLQTPTCSLFREFCSFCTRSNCAGYVIILVIMKVENSLEVSAGCW